MITDEILTSRLKPLILLADSQLLFLKENEKPYIARLRQLFSPEKALSAVYLGASNGDQDEFFQIFQLAMENLDVSYCRHLKAPYDETTELHIKQADIILLSGGDTQLGWQALKPLANALTTARSNGAVIIGTSAGAIQLGALGYYDKPFLSNTDLFATFGFVPAMFAAHEETQQWRSLNQMVIQTGSCLPAIGIPSGAGLLFNPDNTIMAIRKPMVSISQKGNQLRQQSLWQLRC